MYVCYVVVVVLIFATAFPTNGQNSGINSLIITISTVCLILFISGAGTSIVDAAIKYYNATRISRTERAETIVPTTVETDAWQEFAHAIGNWENSIFITPMTVHIMDPWACLRYILGTAFLYSIVIGNFGGPGACLSAAAALQFKLTDKSLTPPSVNSIFTSRWNVGVILSIMSTVVRGTWFLNFLNVLALTTSLTYYYLYEEKTWKGVGLFSSVKSGREI